MQNREKVLIFFIICFNLCVFTMTNTVFATDNPAQNASASDDFALPSFILPDTTGTSAPVIAPDKAFTDPEIAELAPRKTQEIVIKEVVQEKSAKHLPSVKTKNTLVLPATKSLNDKIGIEIINADGSDNTIQQIEIPKAKPALQKDLLVPLAPVSAQKITQSADGDIEKPKVKSFTSAAIQNSNTIPHEIKVSFYPNSTEYSGNAVKWIKALAIQALENPQTAIELRISKTNPALQQHRSNAIVNILQNYGLSLHQIFIVHTNRDADNLVLQTINKPEKKSTVRVKTLSGNTKEKETINW